MIIIKTNLKVKEIHSTSLTKAVTAGEWVKETRVDRLLMLVEAE